MQLFRRKLFYTRKLAQKFNHIQVGNTPSPDLSGEKHEEEVEALPALIAVRKKAKKKGKHLKDQISLASSSASTSEAGTLMSTHSMKMGFYSINLGTATGQRLHTCHLVILPLIPVFILLMQNASAYISNNQSISDLQDVTTQVFTQKNSILVSSSLTACFVQVSNAIDFARLTRMLQEERVSVALAYFIEERENISTVIDLDKYVQSDEKEFIRAFKTVNTFNATDQALQNITYWPKLDQIDYLKTKLKFQIKHALFRSKIKDRDKSIEEVFNWYNEVNGNTLNYVTYSIHDSDISNFYRFIIGYKNLLRSVEFAGKAGILGMEYTTSGLDQEKFENFLEFDILRREYLNQTTNFLPYIQEEYEALNQRNSFDETQEQIRNREPLSRDIEVIVQYFFRFLVHCCTLSLC